LTEIENQIPFPTTQDAADLGAKVGNDRQLLLNRITPMTAEGSSIRGLRELPPSPGFPPSLKLWRMGRRTGAPPEEGGRIKIKSRSVLHPVFQRTGKLDGEQKALLASRSHKYQHVGPKIGMKVKIRIKNKNPKTPPKNIRCARWGRGGKGGVVFRLGWGMLGTCMSND
jgi:hypothetical protein